jgi:hypothetical protein
LDAHPKSGSRARADGAQEELGLFHSHDVVDHTVGRLLDLFAIETAVVTRWTCLSGPFFAKQDRIVVPA